MAVVAPAKPRATVEETPAGLSIVIPARRNWFITLFLGFWLCGWAVGEVMVPTQFFRKGLPPGALLFSIAWLGAWTVGGALAIYAFFWSLLGRERILVSPSSLSVKRELFGRGRTRTYELVHVKNLRVAAGSIHPFGPRYAFQLWGASGGLIAFDHGAATIRFGAGLEEGEASSLVEQVRGHAGGGLRTDETAREGGFRHRQRHP